MRYRTRASIGWAFWALLWVLAGCGGGSGGGAAAPSAPPVVTPPPAPVSAPASAATLSQGDQAGPAIVLDAAPAGAALDAWAYWLGRSWIQWPGQAPVPGGGAVKLYHSLAGQVRAEAGQPVSGADGMLVLTPLAGALPDAVSARFRFIGAGPVWVLAAADQARLGDLLRQQLVLVTEDAQGRVLAATATQLPGVLDELYAAAAEADELGVHPTPGATRWALWAPTAQSVWLYLYDRSDGPAVALLPARPDTGTGIWSVELAGDQAGRYYRYAVDVVVPGVGRVRNLVTDPYAVSLGADSQRAYVADLDALALAPPGWAGDRAPVTVAAAPDQSIYELHVRDFSARDTTVPAASRGKYLAFTHADAQGMRHLAALARAGLTDVHLLPVFDFATVPESGCTTPAPQGAPDGASQQAAVAAGAGTDCYNWGYDPWHFNAPEGSYASDAADGARRIVEFRQMVMALHAAGLRVGMDVVYNHTTASGQSQRAVLDRIVPGYYHRLDASGRVATSTCCDNTAAEHAMMARLMTDSVILWARHYHISSFRFDVMGHHPRAVMQRIQARVESAVGRPVQLLGEGWNFGEVADGARFVQAAQGQLDGTGIGTFSHYARDAVRGGSPFDAGTALVANQGYINGLHYAPNARAPARGRTDLMWQADIIRAGLAGSIRDYTLRTHWDVDLPLARLLVNGQPAGYVSQPDEVVNYVENHDNLTLFDVNAYKLPAGTSGAERARVQMLGVAINAFSQGIAYFHAGVDLLRSKSLDRNSYDSGDWFNRIDWSGLDNGFGIGLPPAGDNGSSWEVMRPLLADSMVRPAPADIAWARGVFRDLLAIRGSTTLLRLRSAADIRQRVRMLNTGSAQLPTVLGVWIDGRAGAGLYPGAVFGELVVLVNVDLQAHELPVPELAGHALELHPVQAAAGATDRRVAGQARFDAAAGRFTIPARSAVAFVARP